MPTTVTIPSAFQPCPPLDAPLRLAFEVGFFGAPRVQGTARADCCSDHFASLTPDGSAGLHQIHEAVDLVSGEGSCVFAVYGGTIVDKGPGKLVIDHQGSGEAYASQYLHIDPGPKAIGDRVIKGEPIASVEAHDAGDHLHFELWHWVAESPRGNPDTEAVPVDPTRLLAHWEQAQALDYGTLGAIDDAVTADLDAANASPAVAAAYAAAGITPPPGPTVGVLASGCVWRLAGGDVMHLLRLERGAITVFDEAYGTRTITPRTLDRIGTVRRWSYPTFLVEADGATYGVPLHQAEEHDRLVVDLIRHAFEHRHPVDLEIRRSPFWRMDGTIDEVAATVTGVRVG